MEGIFDDPEVIVGLTAERAVMMKPPSRRVCPEASVPLEVTLSLRTRRAIDPIFRRHDGTPNESTNVGAKTDRSRVGGPELCV